MFWNYTNRVGRVRHIAQITHMSFRENGTITKTYKEVIERENGQLEEADDYDDIKLKSKTTQTIKVFS